MSEDIIQVLTEPTVDVVLAGRVLGVGKNAAYKARETGDIPSIKVGGQWRVPTAPLRLMLGLEKPAAELMTIRADLERRAGATCLATEAVAA